MVASKALNKFNETSEHWLSDLRDYPEEKLGKKPSSNEWSLAELYDHLMRVANTYQIPNFQECLNSRVTKGKKNFRANIIFDLQLLPYRKMQLESFPENIAKDFTPEIKPKEVLLKEFGDWVKYVEALSEKVTKANPKVKHHHPLFGWINAIEWFSLIEIHIRHHTRQKKRIENFINN